MSVDIRNPKSALFDVEVGFHDLRISSDGDSSEEFIRQSQLVWEFEHLRLGAHHPVLDGRHSVTPRETNVFALWENGFLKSIIYYDLAIEKI